MKHPRMRLLSPLASLLVLLSSVGCIAVIIDDDAVEAEEGRIGAGGSLSIAISDHWPFEMFVVESEVTLLVRDRTIVLPHYCGAEGVRFHDFDYDDCEISIHLGHGVEACIDGTHLKVGGHRYALPEPGTYFIDAEGGYTFESR